MNLLDTVKVINLGVAFLLEVAMFVAFGYWGFQSPGSLWMKWALGIGLPFVVAVLWGLVLAPRARQRLNLIGGVVLSSGLFGLAALALYQTQHSMLALTLAVVALINRALVLYWKQW